MLKKPFWMKFKELFKTQYFIAARIETKEDWIGEYTVQETKLVPIFKDQLIELYNLDLSNIVLISTSRGISNG